MAIIKIKRFGRIQDEDFYEDIDRRKKEATSERRTGTAAGAVLGGLVGSSFGKGRGRLVGAGIGALGVGALAHVLGKNEEKKVHSEQNKYLRQYKNAKSEKDREYIRHRAHNKAQEKLQKQTRDAARAAAWNSAW